VKTRNKTLYFDALIEKRLFTNLQAQKTSQQPTKQLNPLDLSNIGIMACKANCMACKPIATALQDRALDQIVLRRPLKLGVELSDSSLVQILESEIIFGQGRR
jgi:hypothetical protein